MPPSVADGFIMLKPESEWPAPKKTRDELLAAIRETVETLPGNSYEFSQPIQLRVNELISGVRSDVAVKVFGDDLVTLNTTAARIGEVLEKVPGANEVAVEQTTGLPMLQIRVDRERAARVGLNIADVQDMIATATAGREAGTLFEGDRRFDIVVRLPSAVRSDIDALKRLPVPLLARAERRRHFITLGEIASFDMAPGSNQMSREQGKRRVVVTANVRRRAIGSFVAEAQQRIQADAKVPTGYWTTWGGQFENLQAAARRLQVVIPASLILVFALLLIMFNNVKDGLLVFTVILFAITGGIFALWLGDIPMPICAAVGFIALSGVGVLNVPVMISFIRSLRDEGRPLIGAVNEGAVTRLRPVLMTALIASPGLAPMAIATVTRAEVQRPLATVVISDVLSSTALTLVLLPLMYYTMHCKAEKNKMA